MKEILKVKNLKTSFYTSNGEVQAVRGVDFELNKGEILGIVGESGSGKSVTVKSIMNIIKSPGKVKEGEIIFKDRDILKLKKEEIRKIKGNDIAMIFQDPMTSLNPVYTVGNQIYETIKVHSKKPKSEIKKRVVSLLDKVKIPSADERVKQYPHEFSGGMRQRVVIAMALANNPDILIADEPTTALDVTIQDQILKLLKELQNKENKSVILITHDLGVIAEMCQNVLVMYGGIIVEKATREDIFYNPAHPYTIGLLNSMPKMDKKERLEAIPGTPPSLLEPPKGCPFTARCKHAMNICYDHLPDFYQVSNHQKARCWLLNDAVKKLKGQ